eukprot:CAMPEP_0177465254 /NCGR_PEP_ID=MMETSP0369-20130122/17313_1 /TAXON_ID=447022 ORGANISM="Scrippsiella hangoei-like, Strain SHHI-4" /NCGR_SAMPLE_ID=MMETSP0369 /ASSEMBLY_ACC=CAM_ASM_000364 /LENGTH=44 /DNA_ID= /DNA_START= /DNA_END= /DNA_ORIENTATION=
MEDQAPPARCESNQAPSRDDLERISVDAGGLSGSPIHVSMPHSD